MRRKIINIDEDKCNGCGLCVNACHEGALIMVEGKAKLVSESYCDGLGDCLPECPTGAISMIEKETLAYDEKAVKENMSKKSKASLPCGCPSNNAKLLNKRESASDNIFSNDLPIKSELMQWPCQIKLVPVNAPYLDNANLLIAADCTAYAYPSIHKLMKNKITLIGCPKLDNTDYSSKLTEILNAHNIKSLTVIRMEVPCCGGIVNAVKQAIINSGKLLPWRIITISTDGNIIED